MASPSYPNHLAFNDWSGTIQGIEIRWHQTAIEGLSSNSATLAISDATAKAMSEHFAYLTAARLGKTSMKILYAYTCLFLDIL